MRGKKQSVHDSLVYQALKDEVYEFLHQCYFNNSIFFHFTIHEHVLHHLSLHNKVAVLLTEVAAETGDTSK